MEQPNNLKLRPCPFCGGIVKFRSDRAISDEQPVILFGIVCSDCGVSLPHLGKIQFKLWDNGDVDIVRDDRQMMVDTWNAKNIEHTED